MVAATTNLPGLDAEVVLRQVGPAEYVVKQRRAGTYFRVGDSEHFLLSQLDGQRSRRDVRKAYRERFAEALSDDDLSQFLQMAREQGLLAGQSCVPAATVTASSEDDEDDDFGSPRNQSWLYFRVRLFDPAPVLNVVEPLIRWVWTPAFVFFSMFYILAAILMLWAHRADFGSAFHTAWRWESFYLAWACILAATVLHEFAHGLTCKHFGGDVHEIGALMLFGTPSMYCDISDSWMIPSRSHRLWITLAGSVSDLLVFATAAFLWRVTMLDSLVNYIAWVLTTVCGTRVFLNLNPLLRLDGYYLASDWLRIPNLRPLAYAYWKGHLRHWLWGAPRPAPHSRGGWLLLYGGISWFFALTVFDALALGLLGFLHSQFGWWGVAVMAVLLTLVGKRVFKGLFTSEFAIMLTTRPQRTAAWLAGIGAAIILLCVVPIDRQATGQFEVRPGVRFEIRSEVAGFLNDIRVVEGDAVQKDQVIARLEVPDLASLIVRKEAEIRESEAQLRKLRMGPRPEEVSEQREKVNRAVAWRDLAQQDLERANSGYEQDLIRLDLEIKQYNTELEYERVSLVNVDRLYQLGAMAGESRRAEQKRFALIEAQLAQANAQKRARQAEGVRIAEAELARRQKDLADTEAALKLLAAGTRPEEIDAENARLARLQEELGFLREQQTKLDIKAPVDGVIATPRMPEKVGQLSEKGGLVCVIEDVRTLNVEIAVAEEDVDGVQPGQRIRLKARALPFDLFEATVDKIAPSATGVQGRQQSHVVVYCHVDNAAGPLKSGMTGYARIQRGEQSVVQWGLRQAMKYLRTEFWW